VICIIDLINQAPHDGPEHISTIVEYKTLIESFKMACDTAKVNFKDKFLEGKALLEIYTCYPIVPFVFLKELNFINTIEELESLLENRKITITGAMNLGKAAWNNPAFYSSILMYKELLEGNINIGGVHGNGGVGYKQAFGIFGKTDRYIN